MTAIVDHSRDHDLTVAGTQAACGWALHLLLTWTHKVTGEPLPLLSWTIRDDEPRLTGLALATSDEKSAQMVAEWASHLNATVSTVPVEGQQRIEFDTVAHGVDIHVYAYIAAATKEAA